MSKSPATHQAPVIIVGLDTHPGLQAARILHRRGVPVIGIADSRKRRASLSRKVEKLVMTDYSAGVVDALRRLGPTLDQRAVLIPCADGHVLNISKHREQLAPWYHVMLPDHDVVRMLMDKVAFYRYAEEHGFLIPQTFILRDSTDVQQAADQLTFPAILKPPARSAQWSRQTAVKAFKVTNADEFIVLCRRCHQWVDTLIAQQWIRGGDAQLYSCNCYLDADSQPLATFVARKLRQWPPEAGDSCLGEECRNDEVLRETVRLFQSVRYRGLGYVEFKKDPDSGKHFIIEPNVGRPTGRSAIAEAGGVDLLYTMYCDVVGLPLPVNRQQTYQGVKWIHLRKDLQSALYYWRKGELTFSQWRRSVRGRKAYALFSWSDPVPFVSDLLKVVRLACSRVERQKRNFRVQGTQPIVNKCEAVGKPNNQPVK